MGVNLLMCKAEGGSYTGTIPFVVESALLYAIAGVAFAVSYGIGSQISILFMLIYAMSTVSLAPMAVFFMRSCC